MSTSPAGPRPARRLRKGARDLLVLGVALVLVGLVLFPRAPVPLLGRANGAGGGGGGGLLPPLNLTLNLTDAPAFDPGVLLVPVSTELHLTLQNLGDYNHSFTLLNRPNFRLNSSWSPAELDAYFHANGSQANVTVAPGGSALLNLSFQAEQAGFSFEFVSVVPYQFEAGMSGFLNVTGPPSGPGVVANVSTSASALAFVPDEVAINASSYPVTVDIAVSNLGSNVHTFWLEGQPNETLLSSNFTTYFQQHPPLASLDVPTTPGTIAWANVSFPAAGVYQYICTVPGHFAAGMTGYFYVGVPAPAVPIPPSTAIVSVWVLWGGAAALVVGSLLAAVALIVGRFPRGPAPPAH